METKETIIQFQRDYQFRLHPKTVSDYQRAVNGLVAFTKKELEDISKRDIRNWLKELSENGYKPNTIYYRLTGLKTFFKYCLEEGLIEKNPAEDIPFPKRGETIPRYLTLKQLTLLRSLVGRNLMECALIEMLYATGVRISELAAMKKAEINWSERTILIPEGKGKKGRIVLFTPICAERVKSYLDSRTDDLPYVFVNALADKSLRTPTVNRKFQSYSRQLGFHVTPHMLRHTFAAHLAQKGMLLEAIQKLLGHDSPHTTQLYARLYDHARKEMYDDWM